MAPGSGHVQQVSHYGGNRPLFFSFSASLSDPHPRRKISQEAVGEEVMPELGRHDGRQAHLDGEARQRTSPQLAKSCRQRPISAASKNRCVARISC